MITWSSQPGEAGVGGDVGMRPDCNCDPREPVRCPENSCRASLGGVWVHLRRAVSDIVGLSSSSLNPFSCASFLLFCEAETKKENVKLTKNKGTTYKGTGLICLWFRKHLLLSDL